MPIAGMLLVGGAGAIVTGFSFVVINYWPLPPSVAPALDFTGGVWWGGVVGAVTGFVLGFVADEKHYEEQSS